jgi:hypothetical protein
VKRLNGLIRSHIKFLCQRLDTPICFRH